MSGITVLAVVSEIYPLIKTGGLADVAGALAGALAAEGVAVVTFVPGYPAVMSKINTCPLYVANVRQLISLPDGEKSGEPALSLWRPSPTDRFGPAFQSSAV
jgi:hypothetical protein